MSTVRRRRVRRNEQVARRRSRAEVRLAVLAGAAVVGGTILGVWLLRPGGLASRQPRVAWLILFGTLAAIGTLWWSQRGRVEQRRTRASVGLASVMIVVVVVWFVWPGGIVRESEPDASDADLSEILGELPTVPPPPSDATTVTTGGAATAPTAPTAPASTSPVAPTSPGAASTPTTAGAAP